MSVAYDGAAALEKAKEWPPDLFLSDVYMPGLSRREAAIAVCEQLPDCKVLLISGQANLKDLHRQIEFKYQRFEVLLKPVHPTELIAHIRAILRLPV